MTNPPGSATPAPRGKEPAVSVLASIDVVSLSLPAGDSAAVLTRGREGAVFGTHEAGGGWWWAPGHDDPARHLGWTVSLARIPGAVAAVSVAAPTRLSDVAGAAGFARRLAGSRPGGAVLAAGPVLALCRPEPPVGWLRIPHLITDRTGDVRVVWEVVAEVAAERVLGHPVGDDSVRAQVEEALPALADLRTAMGAGPEAVPDGPFVEHLAAWALAAQPLDVGLVYRYWPPLYAHLAAARTRPAPAARPGHARGQDRARLMRRRVLVPTGPSRTGRLARSAGRKPEPEPT
ncbi:hypothetical protein AB0M43_36485 [Longispora sp. NPDC051575]|uniref:hypothetical protein n=1 Tax=Longispora sp. NPDC051575 TaxID=3154943 RepID=UPI00342CBF39